MAELRLRPATAADRDFARPIYIATTKLLVRDRPEWTESYIAARFERRFIVETTRMAEIDGVTVGWLRLSETDDSIVLEQIYLGPARQNQGIGSRLLAMLDDEWRAAGKPVRLAVLKTNPAKRLYERFGFRVIEEKELAWLMAREPAGS